MNQLENLIQTLCPDGVEYLRLADVSSIFRGVTYPKSAEVNSSNGHKILRANNITLTSNTLNYADVRVISDSVKFNPDQKLRKNDILICTASGSKDHIGKVAYIHNDSDYYFGGFMAVIRAKTTLLSRFLFHLLMGLSFSTYLENTLNSSTINNLNSTILGGFKVPIPPLPIQQEIVRILDTMTDVVAELEAELSARDRQYEHYKESLFTNSRDVPINGLGDVCEFVRGPFGGSLKKDCFVSNGFAVYEQQHAIYGDFTFRYYVDEKKFQEMKRFQVQPGDLIMSCSGTMGKVSIIPDNAKAGIINQALLKLKVKNGLSNRYLNYYFNSKAFINSINSRTQGGAIKNVASVAILKTIPIPVPPKEEQNRIVAILDHFDALVHDLKTGLPAEIALRRKQYETYRDKLLTFKENPA